MTFVIQTTTSTKPLRVLIISQVAALSHVSQVGVLPKKRDFFCNESEFFFLTPTLLDGIKVLTCFQRDVKTRWVTNKKRLKLQTAAVLCFQSGC